MALVKSMQAYNAIPSAKNTVKILQSFKEIKEKHTSLKN